MASPKKTYIIDAKYERDAIIDWIKDYFVSNGNEQTKAVIGISGGKDSTIAAALLVRALGKDRVVGVIMPNGQQHDIDDAYEVCRILNIQHYIINIRDTYNTLKEDFVNHTELPLSPQIESNTPARLRMTALYMVASAVGGRVCNTGNASELYVGYTTKYGDLAGDFALFSSYHVRDVISIGLSMPEIPEYLVRKTPEDGMCGQNDESNLGFSYKVLDNYILDKKYPSVDIVHKIETRHNNNRHKTTTIHLPHPSQTSRHDSEKEFIPEDNPFYF